MSIFSVLKNHTHMHTSTHLILQPSKVSHQLWVLIQGVAIHVWRWNQERVWKLLITKYNTFGKSYIKNIFLYNSRGTPIIFFLLISNFKNTNAKAHTNDNISNIHEDRLVCWVSDILDEEHEEGSKFLHISASYCSPDAPSSKWEKAHYKDLR